MAALISHDNPIVRLYRTIIAFAGHLQSLVLLLLRLSWGYQLAESGYGHLTHVQDTVEQFIRWGVPAPHLSVYVSGLTELAGGILLMLGLGARLIAIPLVFNFIVAIVSASRGDIAKAFHDKGLLGGWDQIVNDTAFPFLMLALLMVAFGAGKASLDYLLGAKMFCRGHPKDHPGN